MSHIKLFIFIFVLQSTPVFAGEASSINETPRYSPELTKSGSRVTTVTENSDSQKNKITENMGLELSQSHDPADSLSWWPRTQDGWDAWRLAQAEFPRAKAKNLEVYLAAVGSSFSQIFSSPQARFHFYIADTLNPSLWPMGGGFFVIHAGIFRLFPDFKATTFLIALELAHDVLGHNFKKTGLGFKGDIEGWPILFWSYLVKKDPVEKAQLSYTIDQESDALELVYQFFLSNGWDFDETKKTLVSYLDRIAEVPGSSSLGLLHKNMSYAIHLPHHRLSSGFKRVDPMLTPEFFERAIQETESSDFQHYGWMLELIGFRDFLSSRRVSLKIDLKNLDKIVALMGGEKAMIRPLTLALHYVRGMLYLHYGQWKDLLKNSQKVLLLEPKSEPFLWLAAIARQQLKEFNRCAIDSLEPWKYFDHRREILLIECSFLEGRYTDVAKLAEDFRKKYPYDFDGAFWQLLTFIRMRQNIETPLKEIELFWGDRPGVRALKTFHYAYLQKPSDAELQFHFKTRIRYLPEEWGRLHFAQAWYRATYTSQLGKEERSLDLLNDARSEWPVARLLKYNLPREPYSSR